MQQHNRPPAFEENAFTPTGSATPEPITMRDVLGIFRRRAALSVVVFAATLAATFLVTSRMTPVYEASASLLLENRPATAIPTNVLDILGGESHSPGDVEVAKIQSRAFLSEVIRKVNHPSITDPDDLKNRLVVSFVAGDAIMKIGATVKNYPDVAAKVANTVARVYIEYARTEQEQKVDKSRSRLERVMHKAEAEKIAANKALQDFMRRHGVADLASYFTTQTQKTINVKNTLQDAERDLPVKEQNIQLLIRQVNTINPTVIGGSSANRNGQLDSFEDDVVRLQAEREIKRGDFGEKSPEIVEIDQRIVAAKRARARAALNAFRPGSVGYSRNPDYAAAVSNLINARRDYTQSVKQIAELRKQLITLQAEQFQIAPERVEYQDLELQVGATTEAYRKARLALINIPFNQITSVDAMRILEPARVPTAPKSPKPMLNLLLGLGGGLVLALASAIVAEYFAAPMKPRQDQGVLLPGLPKLPAAPVMADTLPRVAGVPLLARVPIGGSRGLPFHTETGLPATGNNASTEDAFREIGYLLSHPLEPSSARVPVVLMAGTRTDETTATIAAYLAATLVRDGVRVTLVDGDRAEPRLHKVFGRPDAPGVADILAGRVSAADALHIGANGNLRFLAAGTKDDPAAVAEEPLRILYNQLGRPEETDLVVVSGPSVWAARLVAPMEQAADGVVLVASDAEVAPEESVARARRILTNGYQPRFLGVIVGVDGAKAQPPALEAKETVSKDTS